MAEIKILVEGYARDVKGTWFVSPNIVLIKENGINTLVDPGCDRERLVDSLGKEGMMLKDIDYVVITHPHLDHCLLMGIFENAKVLDNDEVCSCDGTIKEHEGKVPGTGVQIIKTPGHDRAHCSLVVDTEELGKVVVAGDVFWWSEDEEQKTDKESLMSHEDPFVKDRQALKESREKVLKIADYIIPGHGKMFKVEK